MIAKVAKAGLRVVQEAASVVGVRSGTQEPQYVVEGRIGEVEIRRYGPRIAAETTVFADDEAEARNRGFRRLAGYIFGGNHTRTKIAMTAPVTQQTAGQKIAMTAPVSQSARPDGAWVIRFFMPAGWTLDTLPVPNDETITLASVEAEVYAVLRFRGSWGPASVAARADQLTRAVANSDHQASGAPMAWFYDPPWTVPMLRRNEVAVKVTSPS